MLLLLTFEAWLQLLAYISGAVLEVAESSRVSLVASAGEVGEVSLAADSVRSARSVEARIGSFGAHFA
jgi:hypothetical protein